MHDRQRPETSDGDSSSFDISFNCKDRCMKTWQKISFGLVVVLAALSGVSPAQDEGPKKDVGETVAKPRKKDTGTADSEQPKIPSKLSNKHKADNPPKCPSFKRES